MQRRCWQCQLKHAPAKRCGLLCLWRRKRATLLTRCCLYCLSCCRTHMRKLAPRCYEIKREQKIIEYNNAGCFYRFVNNKLSCGRGLGELGDGKVGIIVSDAEWADLLNDYFGFVCTADNGTMTAVERLVPNGVDLEPIEFTPGEVHASIKKLKAGGASGSNGFLPLLFKKTAGCICGTFITNLLFVKFVQVSR